LANRIFRIRLSENHWVWNLPQKERGVVVKNALDSYWDNTNLLKEIKNLLENLRKDLKIVHGEFKITEQKTDNNPVKKRLMASKGKWLNTT